MTAKTIAVTFDSNVWEEIVLPDKLAQHALKSDLQELRDAISAGKIEPYISDVIFVLEAVRKVDRASYLQSFSMQTSHKDDGLQGYSEEGLPIYQHTITMTANLSHPGLQAQLSEALKAALAMGFKLIKVNRIGFPMVEAHLYKLQPKTEPQNSKDIFGAFEQEGLGSAQAAERGRELKNTDLTLPATLPDLIALGFDDPKSVQKLVAEWADGDALIAHYEYGHDYFCTLDTGSGAGAKSVLHQSRRSWLKGEFGIEVVSPTELAEIVRKL